MRKLWTGLLVLAVLSPGWLRAEGAQLDSAKIEQLTGAKGAWNKDQTVFKVGFPARK